MSEREAPGVVSGLVQAALTFMVAAIVGQAVVKGGDITIPGPYAGSLAMVLVGFASVGLWQWRKRRAASGLTTGQMVAQRLAEVERREAEADAVQERLAELEERLDFSERLLAQGNRVESPHHQEQR